MKGRECGNGMCEAPEAEAAKADLEPRGGQGHSKRGRAAGKAQRAGPHPGTCCSFSGTGAPREGLEPWLLHGRGAGLRKRRVAAERGGGGPRASLPGSGAGDQHTQRGETGEQRPQASGGESPRHHRRPDGPWYPSRGGGPGEGPGGKETGRLSGKSQCPSLRRGAPRQTPTSGLCPLRSSLLPVVQD